MVAILPAIFLAVCLQAAPPSAKGNLIEYSYGGFADGDAMSIGLLSGPMLYPPPVKVYQDGRIVFLGTYS